MIYDIVNDPKLDDAVMVSALSGWVDAASAGTNAADHLARNGEAVVRFDPDTLFDYRSQRPILDIIDGKMERTVWPELSIRHSVVGGRNILVLTGQEPDLNWRKFSSAVGELALRLKVTKYITLGSVPAAVPHTLPPPILTTASDDEVLQDDVRPPQGLLRVPAAAVSMADQAVAGVGVPTVGFFVQVPHYVTGNYPSGVLALLHRFEKHALVQLDLSDLEESAELHKKQLDEIVSGQPEVAEHIHALEQMSVEQQAVSGEELATEIERYLREEGGRPDGD